MTLLQMVNRVLRRLREDQVTDLTTDAYSKLVATFVADAHREVVEAHDWAVMDKGVVITVTAGVSTYSLSVGSTDLYAGYTGVSSKALVRYLDDAPIAYIYESIANLGNGDPLNELVQADYAVVQDSLLTRVSTQNRPSRFALMPTATGLQLVLDAPADGTYYLYIRLHDPELEIDVDTDSARDLVAPYAPIVAGATYYALNERGEEMGEPGNVAERRYIAALGTAIETDTILATRTNTHEMYRD
jgi:hypothetical protein